MGYSSNVVIAVKYNCITDDILEKLVEFSDQIHFEIDENDCICILFEMVCIKWSELDPECLKIITWYKELDRQDYKVIIIGEEMDDMSYEGNLRAFEMGIKREITFNEGDVFEKDEDYSSIKVDLSIPSKETVFKRIQDVCRSQEQR